MIPQNYLTQVVNLMPVKYKTTFPLTLDLINYDAVVMLKPESTIGTLRQGEYYFIKYLSDDERKIKVKSHYNGNLSGALNLTNFNSIIGVSIPYTRIPLTKSLLKMNVKASSVISRIKALVEGSNKSKVVKIQARNILNFKDE